MKKHRNIPVFIPHLGCPHDCVFCNQRTISGKMQFEPSSVDREISAALSTIDRQTSEVEIAFFGGSFTGIDRDLMVSLLRKAHGYIERGQADAIRISTRPDYIDPQILAILREYGVTDIELGIQSMDDTVLSLCRRGHTADQSRKACAMITDAGFSLVGQMMIGLPGATAQSELQTAEQIAYMGANGARVYPTVVFRDTHLAALTTNGAYIPLTNDRAVTRCADVLDIFDREKVKVLRVGLCAQENLCDASAIAAGEYDPAIGERAQSELFYRRITSLLTQPYDKALTIECPVGAISKVIGHKKANLERLRTNYGIKELKVVEKNTLVGYNIRIN